LILVTGDHTTCSPTLLEFAHPESLRVISASVEAMERRIFEGKPWDGTPRLLEAKALPILDEVARHTGLSADDIDRLLLARNHYERQAALGKAISRRFGIGFMAFGDYLDSSRQHGHTGDPVPVRAWGPRAREVAGIRNHAEFGRWIAEVLELPGRTGTAEVDSKTTAGAKETATANR
jgi:alkaline phosphatase